MRPRIAIFTLLAMFILVSSSQAYYGTRPMGMGGAFTAVANDANAAYWNPAGFALNPGVDITGSTLLTNRNDVIGDNLAAVKMCYEAPMSSPFEWIFGIGMLSSMAVNAAQYLGDMGVLKKNWGRPVEKTNPESSMASQVKAGGSNVTSSINPFKLATPKPDGQYHPLWTGPLNLTFNFNPPHRSYLDSSTSDNSSQNMAQFALGLTWLYDNNPPLDQSTNWYTISVASGWEERVAVGANLNLYDLKIISNNIKEFGAGFDFGAIAKPLPNFSVGLAAKETLTTDINWQNGSSTRYEMMINGGVAIDPTDDVTIAVDSDNIFSQNNENPTMHYGLEVRPVNGLALRCGLYDGSKTAGASVGVGSAIVDYAYLGGAFNRTQMVGATWKF